MFEKKLLNALIEKYSNNVVKSHYNRFKVSSENLSEIFDIVNRIVFTNRLEKIPIKIELKTSKIPGKAVFCYDKISNDCFIRFYRNSGGDNFLKMLSAFCHEMIHYYDFCFGKWSKLADKYSLETDFTNKVQYVGRYDIHGDYFMSWIKEFKKNGIVVEKYYAENIVGQRFFEENKLDEIQSSKEKVLEKTIYDSIVTDGFKAVSVTKNHIYIVVD